MSWRWWRKPRDIGGAEVPDTLIARADALRDQRHWAAAAAAYRTALDSAPHHAAVWVQLGHALKESGDLPGAEAAYRRSLELAPRIADTHLQLGHALKLQGRRAAAVAAYAHALRVDRTFTPALTELIALGEGWAAEQESGAGQHMLGGMLQAMTELHDTLARLERALPDVAALNSFPLAAYALFRARHRLPPPPEAPPALRWAVLAIDTAGGDPVALLRALAAQDVPPVAVTLANARDGLEPELRQMAFGGLACPVAVAPRASRPAVPECDWLLAVSTAALPVPAALTWLGWAAAQVDAAAIYADEDHVTAPGAAPDRPVLKAAHDPDAEPALYVHGMLAVRTDAARPMLAQALAAPDPVGALAAALADRRLAHLPRILSSRLADPPPPAAIPRDDPTDGAPTDGRRIGVVIPTRNGAALLAPCLDALRATAERPEALEVVVLDNGSDDAATLGLLEALRTAGTATVLSDDAPFNWAGLSNRGAAACRAELLLFLNDDVTITTRGWDTMLRRHLARGEIGAVGARLSYPEGGLQHAGMVLGPDGRAEHEGIAPIGIPPEVAARWKARRRVGAVTGAMLACRRDAFEAVGRFDEASLPIWFNDVDFCLRLRRAGLLVLYAPEIAAVHHESRTLRALPADERRRAIWDGSLAEMRRRWGEALATDPGFNPQFARTGRPFEALCEPSPAAIRAHLLRSARPDPWVP
jgi:GT2 family glycosyltransferase/tetratricopeptide (TPR) repeat protein